MEIPNIDEDTKEEIRKKHVQFRKVMIENRAAKNVLCICGHKLLNHNDIIGCNHLDCSCKKFIYGKLDGDKLWMMK